MLFPFPVGALPKTRGLADLLTKPVEWMVVWFAQSTLGVSVPAVEFNGSGDRSFDYVALLLFAVIAAVGALIWSIADRRRMAYPALAAGAHVVLRYVLASAMLEYGISKILRQQFSENPPARLLLRLGDMSPMGLLWTFMSYSRPYTIFAGLGEAIGGVLLLWRRTATIGALIVIPVMANVVMLNFCYDVPVKLYSTQLLAMAVLIVLPDARRLVAAALGQATAGAPRRARSSPRWERARVAAALTMTTMFALNLYLEYRDAPDERDHVHELYGNWAVDQFSADGVERPPSTTDSLRWQELSVNPGSLAPWLMSGDHESPGLDGGAYGLTVDAAKHTMTVTVDRAAKLEETWTYTRSDPDHLIIEGAHRGERLHVELHRKPEPLLLSRGFHWINEAPLSR